MFGPSIHAPSTTDPSPSGRGRRRVPAGLRRVRHRRQPRLRHHEPRLRPHRRAVRRTGRLPGAAHRPAVPAAAAGAGTGFVFAAAGEVVAWSRILDREEALLVINANGEAGRGGDIVVAAELSSPGHPLRGDRQLGAGGRGRRYTGTHPVGSTLPVRRNSPAEPAYLELRDISPAETVILLRRP